MDGVLNIASDHSDADLLIKNMIGVKKGVYGGTAEQTVTMAYSGNKDSLWDESNMTVFYDQDYLTRTAEKSGAELEVRIANIYQVAKAGEPTLSFEKITINLADGAKINGKSSIEVDITSAQGEKGDAAYAKVVELMNDAFTANGWANVSAKTIAARDAYFSDDVETYTAGSLAGQYLPILVTNTGAEEFAKASFVSNSAVQDGNRLETSIVDPTLQSDTPVSINVDLEKVGNAADGGALIIGSMNKNADNIFGQKQSVTTTDTLAGFDEFNVSVIGDKSKNSSLSKLLSTDNTLRKVTIDSVGTGNANLTIGNKNTTYNNTVVDLNSSGKNALAFKDVQIMDASAFKGDLVLNAGFTSDIVVKYLANTTDTTVYGLNNAAKELAEFSYKGGAGNDKLNLALNLEKIANANFTDNKYVDATPNYGGTGTNGDNVFKMKIEGGAGNDNIIVDADTAGTFTGITSTNITIDGGLGNDTIDICSNCASWSYNVAFNETIGHDTVKGFNVGAVTLTNETQSIELAGFTAHKGEVIVVTVGGVSTTHTVATADLASGVMNTNAILLQVEKMLEAPDATGAITPTATQKFDNGTGATIAGTKLNLLATDKNVNSVTVEIRSQVEAGGTYDKDTTPIHTETSVTHSQGGLLNGATGADTLDFSAYNVKGVVIERGATDLFGTDAGTQTGTATSIFATAGNQFIYLEASAHDASVYNVYMATSKVAAPVTNIDFGATGNATKGAVIGSINLDSNNAGTAVNYAAIDASQLLF